MNVLRVMGEDGARGKDWLRARGHHLCLTDTIFYFFLFFFFYSRSGWESLAGYYRSRMQKGTSFAQNLIKVYVFYTHI